MKKLFLILLSLIAVTYLHAEITVKAKAPSAVAVGERFRVEFTINERATEIRFEFDDPGMQLLYGPSTGSMYSNMNGVQTVSTTFTYTFMPKAEGTFTIPAATVMAGGKPYTSGTATVTVLPADHATGTNQNNRKQQQNSQKINADDVHLDLVLSKTSAYMGEAIVATLKLYFRNTPIHSITDFKLPDLDGFTVQDMDLGNPEPTLERYKNANYSMYPIKQWLLFPSRVGEITIPSAYVNAIAQVVTRRSTGGWFDFPMDYTSNVEVPINSAPKTIRVSALPSGKPLSYSNGVGDFKIKSELTSNHVKANDAIIYRVTIEGTGNLKYINDPEPEFPSDFEVYEPKNDITAKTTSQGLSGKKVVEYTVIPRHAGSFEIPALEFSYFDVKAGQYKTLTTDSYSVEVERGIGENFDNQGNVSNYSGPNQERLKVLGNDIRYIHKLDMDSMPADEQVLFGSFNYWLFYIIPIVLLLILAIVYRRQLKLNADADLLRTRKANKVASRRLKDADVALKAKNENDFYEAIHKAMFGYVSDKLNIKLSELTISNVKEQLAAHKVSADLIAKYEDIVSTCEFARYAPSKDDQAMDQLYKKASECINSLESQIKK